MSQEIKSKEDIISEECAAWNTDLYSSSLKPHVLKSMNVYAEQESIAFAEWLTSKESPYSPLYGESERWCDSEREYTTAQLYEQFKQQKL